MSAFHDNGPGGVERPWAHELYLEARRARAAMIADRIARAVLALARGIRSLTQGASRPFAASARRSVHPPGGSSHHGWNLT